MVLAAPAAAGALMKEVESCRYNACAEHLRERHGPAAGLLSRCILRAAKLSSINGEPCSEKISMAATENQIRASLKVCSRPDEAENVQIPDLSEALQ